MKLHSDTDKIDQIERDITLINQEKEKLAGSQNYEEAVRLKHILKELYTELIEVAGPKYVWKKWQHPHAEYLWKKSEQDNSLPN